MGADFICGIIPKCKETAERRAALSAIASRVAAELTEDDDREGIEDAVTAYWDVLPDSRETCFVSSRDFSFDFLVTGGMSWGEWPTDACEIFSKLECSNEVYEQLRKWALEDRASKTS